MRCIEKSKVLLYILLGILSLGFCLIKSENVSAFSFGAVGNTYFNPGWGHTRMEIYNGVEQEGPGPTILIPFSQSDDHNFVTANTGTTTGAEMGNLTHIYMETVNTLPANALFTFSVRYLTTNYQHAVEYRGEWAGNFTLLNKTCNSIADTDSGITTFTSGYTCTYWGYKDQATNYLTFRPSVYYYQPLIVQMSGGLTYTQIITESGGGGYSGLTQADKEWLQSQIGQVITSNNTGNTAINNVASEIQEMNERAEEEREEMEDNQEELSDSAENSSEQAESTGQTLLAAFTGFVNAITNADATNCTIPGNLGHFNMGNLNLCRDNPPALVTTIGSIFMILFFVPLSYATATKVIALFRSFQS